MASADPKSGQSLSALAKFGFVDLERSIANLDQLVSLVGDSGRSALAFLGETANPDQALDQLIRLAEKDKSKIKKILGRHEPASLLTKLLGASVALAEFIQRYPEVLAVLEKPISSLRSKQDMLRFFQDRVLIAAPTAEVVTELRRTYRVLLLEIAVYDLIQKEQVSALPQVAKSLADLAGAVIEHALKIARFELVSSQEFGVFTSQEVEQTRLAVIGMGKGGAGELNYISDVDVIYVAESASSELPNERMLEIATKLATRMMRAIDSNNAEPALWQVDANLRPEGKSGALVRTLDSHLAYYDRWAENWEFQALLKANPIAGDMDLGARYFDAINPLVWKSSRRENFVESVQKMRERVTENIAKEELDWQIKLGIGGLRDIEFTVQLLQLVHGREDASVRAPDTVTAISQLSKAGYIGRSEANLFSQNYKFLRLIEHRIQLMQMRRTHLMPKDPESQRVVARSISPTWTAEKLISEWTEIKSEVRALHQKIFYRPLLVAVAKAEGGLSLSDEQAMDRLSAIGFTDPRGAMQHIQALTSGLSRRAQIQRQLLPVLIEWFGQGTDPDAALLAFRRLSENLGESHWYLRMLRDSSGAAERLSNALSNSRLATSLLELIPEGAAWLDDPSMLQPSAASLLQGESESLALRHQELDDFAKAVKHMRRRETLRLALGAVVGELSLAELERGLTELTQWYLCALLDAVLERKEHNQEKLRDLIDFGMVAMGRFGGSELGFGSDADVMAVYEPKPTIAVAIAQKASELAIAELKRLAVDPQLEFEIDMDLRPEGKNGPVARSLESYRAYYARWSDVWENQALLRARIFYGSNELKSGFAELVDSYRYPEKLDQKAIVEIRRIKARMESERLPQGADSKRHLKLGRGSLSDIEWVVQILQLKHGNDLPEIRTPRTLDALDALVANGIIENHDARVLKEAWLLCSRVRSASVLWSNKRSDVLPSDRRQLEGMARILEYPRGSATVLEEDYLSRTRRARSVFERLFFA